MSSLAFILLQIIVLVILAPLSSGIIAKVKAISQKRKGPPLLQRYLDLFKLFKKEMVISETASWVFRATPYITIVTALLAGLFVPITLQLGSLGFAGDLILVVYTLGLGRFFMALAALDTGSTFGGMGSSREMLISALMEPALLVALFTLGLLSGSTSIYQIMYTSASSGFIMLQPVYWLLAAAIFIILIAETARIPVDDPATHLELTMVHEAMLLEYSGRYLALMELAAAVKQLIFLTLLANIFIPLGGLFTLVSPAASLVSSLAVYFLKIVFLSLIIGLFEINTVKLRFFSVPNLAAVSFTLSFLAFVQYYVIGR